MLISGKIVALKIIRLAVIATLLVAGGNKVYSDEPAKDSQKRATNNAVAPKKNLLHFRAYRPSDSIFNSQNVDVPTPMIVPAPTPQPSARTSREERERLDRQKNWIFVLPDDEKKAETMEEILGVDALTLENGSKSVLTKFLENKRANDPAFSETNSDPFKRNESRKQNASPVFGDEKRSGAAAFISSLSRPENSLNASGSAKSMAERWQEMHGPQAEKAREEKRARMNEFQNLFGPSGSFAGNGISPLQSNLGLQPATPTPFAGGLDNFNRPAPSSPSQNVVRPNPAASPLQQPNAAPVFGTDRALTPTPERTRTVSQPAVLPVPKRQF